MALVLFSCSTSNQTTTGGGSEPTTIAKSATVISATGGEFLKHLMSAIKLPNGMTQADFDNQRSDAGNAPEGIAIFELKKKVDGTTNWMMAHHLIQEYIENTKGRQFAWYHHQLVAATTLNDFVSTLPVTPDVQKAIEYYIGILLLYNNTNEVIAMGKVLPMMQGYWSREKIAEVAMRHYKVYGKQTPPMVYVTDAFIARAETTAKKSPEKYSTSDAVVNLSKDIRKQFWQDYLVNMIQRAEGPSYSKQISFESYSKAGNNSRLIVAILANDYTNADPASQR